MAEIKRVVFAIIEFLDDQIVSGDLTEDAVESMEVAKQCLETAYGLNLSQDTEYRVNQSLLDIFNAVAGAPNIVKRAPSEEGVIEAEKMKMQGNECMKVDNFKEAIDFYSQAIKLDWTKSVYYCNRAAAYSKVNNHSAAICDCKKAIEIDKDYSKAFGRMGLAYMGLLDYTQAIECYRRALELEPDNEGYKTNLETAEKQEEEAKKTQAFGGAGASGGLPGMPGMPGGFNLSALMSDPGIMNMAQNLMTRPEMRNMLSGVFSGQAGGEQNAGMNDLMKKTYDLAQQMQSERPDLMQNLRQQYQGDGSNQENPDENSTENSSKEAEEDKKEES